MSEQANYCDECSSVYGVAVSHYPGGHKTPDRDSRVANLERAVVEACVRFHKADLRLQETYAIPVEVCHEYDAAQLAHHEVTAALIAAREQVEKE